MAEEKTKTLGDRVRELRKRRGWSQEELSQRARMKPSTLGNIEQNRQADVSAVYVYALARALGVTMEHLTVGVEAVFVTPALSADEEELLKIFNAVKPAKRSGFLELLRGIAPTFGGRRAQGPGGDSLKTSKELRGQERSAERRKAS